MNYFLFTCWFIGVGAAVISAYYRGRLDALERNIRDLQWIADGCRGPNDNEIKMNVPAVAISVLMACLFVLLASLH